MRTMPAALLSAALAASAALANDEICEISVSLKLDEASFVAGERVRGVIDVKNMSQDEIKVDGSRLDDRLFVEVFADLSSGRRELDRTGALPFVSPFKVGYNEGQLLETIVSDHFTLDCGRYLVRPVLVHGRVRFEGEYRVFDVVPGVVVTKALQMFAKPRDLRRNFEVIRWSRRGREHLFLAARDAGEGGRRWRTTDMGIYLKLTPPTISILPTGEVVVVHRVDQDHFLRSEFWSLPDAVEFRSQEVLKDPETAGQSSVQEMYNKSGGVKAAPRPWWKFW